MIAKGRQIRVLVVDDSLLVREMIGSILAEEQDILVVGEAVDGRQAINMAASLKPDIITMDIEMPVLGGFEAIERIMADRPVPILVVTALTGVRIAFNAVSKGALDVIEKPDISQSNAAMLVQKIRLLARVDVKAQLAAAAARYLSLVTGKPGEKQAPLNRAEIVAIAASTGGPQAIRSILAALPASFPLPIVIAQHNADGFSQGMVDWLGGETKLKVELASHGGMIVGGRVYVNPSEYSMYLGTGGHMILGDKLQGQTYSPSCNTLLASVAAAYRERSIGVILSGMGDDGVAGIQAIKNMGGSTIAQDAASSVIYGMNQCAVERGWIDKVLPLSEIPAELIRRAADR